MNRCLVDRVTKYVLAGAAILHVSTITRADEVDECLAKLQKAHEELQTFEQTGEITCPAGDVVGFPPQIRRNDRAGVVTYAAPTGFIIRNQSISSVQIENVSQNDGSYGSPSIAPDGGSVTIPIACKGKNPTEGRSWQHIRVTGTIIRVATSDMIKDWAVQCVRCVARRNCPS
jgi:hypothetical protein